MEILECLRQGVGLSYFVCALFVERGSKSDLSRASLLLTADRDIRHILISNENNLLSRCSFIFILF